METMKSINERWRKYLFKLLIYITLVVSLTEALLLYIQVKISLAYLPLPIYIFRFFILPVMINFSVIGIGYLLLRNDNITEERKNSIICVLCFLVSATIQIIHNISGPALCVPAVAVFIAGSFQSITISRKIAGYSIVTLCIATLLNVMESRVHSDQLYLDAVVAFVIILAAYASANVYIKKEKDIAITLRKGQEKQVEMEQELKKDVLTGLFNKKDMYIKIQQAIDNQEEIYLAIIDIDDFKLVNDTYGHLKGDEVLLYLSGVLGKACFRGGYPIRFGGEEFAIVFSGLKEKEVLEALYKIKLEISSHAFFVEDPASYFFVTVSIGVVKYDNSLSVTELFEAADDAMYAVKRKGKNDVNYVSTSDFKDK